MCERKSARSRRVEKEKRDEARITRGGQRRKTDGEERKKRDKAKEEHSKKVAKKHKNKNKTAKKRARIRKRGRKRRLRRRKDRRGKTPSHFDTVRFKHYSVPRLLHTCNHQAAASHGER